MEKVLNLDEWKQISNIIDKQILMYDDKYYVDFKEIYLENEFHFDGITSPNLSRVPGLIGFQGIEEGSTDDEGQMKLVNCEMAVKEIDADKYIFLKNAMIDYYGMATYKNKNPKKEERTFELLRCEL